MYIKKYSLIRYIIKSVIFIGFFRYFYYYFKFLCIYVSSEIEIKKIEYYLTICNKIEHKQKSIIVDTQKRPVISIISPIFNREKYIFRFIKAIQNQNFNNIEIILIDDNSIDNSVKKNRIIEKR